MRVLFFTNQDRRLPGGKRCYVLSDELVKHGIQAEVISTVDYLSVPYKQREVSMGDIQKLKTQIRVYRKIKHEKDAILYLQRVDYHIIAPLLLQSVYRNKLILDVDDWALDANIFRGLSLFPSYKIPNLFSRIASRSDACVAISYRLKALLEQYNKNVYYIPPLVKAQSRQVKRSGGQFVFCWIGTVYRDDDLENIRLVIYAFASLIQGIDKTNVYLDIVGGGPLFDRLSLLQDTEHVRLKGWLTQSKMENYLQNIDVGLIPLVNASNYNIYKTPTKLFDFMSVGKPVIVSNIGETKDLVSQTRSGLIAENKLSSWRNAMLYLFKQQEDRELLGLNAYNALKDKFSVPNSVTRLYELLRKT